MRARLAVLVAALALGLSASGPPVPGSSRAAADARPSPAIVALATARPATLQPTRSAPSRATPTISPIATPRPAVRAASMATPRPAAPTTLKPAPKPTPRPAPKPPPPTTACPLYPSTNVWNKRIDGLPVAANSSTLVSTIGAAKHFHPDFGSYAGYGIPYNVVGSSTPRVHVTFDYADESDAGPYPIPSNPKIEAGSDRHLLMWDTAGCRLYELFAAVKTSGGWHAGSGAIWNLRSNALRPDGWTSADAAGLPILPGLVRYDEVVAGVIRHAIRFTAPVTRSAHIYPARHDAGAGSSASLPPMGTRLRLKASVSLAGFSPRMRVILVAMQRYGIILADNGSPWFFSGASDPRWNDDELNQLKSLIGSDFEVVSTAGFVNG